MILISPAVAVFHGQVCSKRKVILRKDSYSVLSRHAFPFSPDILGKVKK
jgi:hypothetical protein